MAEPLRELGYVEGRNLVVDYRHAETEEGFRDLPPSSLRPAAR